MAGTAAGAPVNQYRFGLGPQAPNPSISPSSNAFGSPSTFSAAVNTQSADYDRIMKSYEDLMRSSSANQMKFNPITPQLAQYSQSPESSSAISNLGSLSSTGGYSEGDVANIRARGISPIRSIYANAQRGLDRTRALQGGYSPNYTAATGKMAREMSEQLAGASTNIEAGIADARAKGRLSIAPSWASAAGEADRARTAVEQSNANTVNQVNELNQRMALEYGRQNQENMFRPAEGMRALYGTTPGLVSTFGNQVAQAAQLGQGQQEINNRRRTDAFGRIMPMLG